MNQMVKTTNSNNMNVINDRVKIHLEHITNVSN